MFYLQKIHSEVSSMGKSTVCSLLWHYGGTPMRNRKTACFEALVLEPHIAQILRPLLATLLPPLLAEFAASFIIMEDAKCEMAGLSNTCGLPMFK